MKSFILTLAVLVCIGFSATATEAQTAIFKDTLSGSTGNWKNVGLRTVIAPAALSGTTGTTSITVKIATAAGTGTGSQIAAAWLGEGASSGNTYNFDGNQVQLTVGGSKTVAINGAVSITFDAATFNYNPAKNLVLAIDFANVGGPVNCATQTNANVSSWYGTVGSAGNTTTTMSGAAGQNNPFIAEIDASTLSSGSVVQKGYTVTGVPLAPGTLTLNVPSGVSNGDLLTAAIATESPEIYGEPAIVAPTGWTLAYTYNPANGEEEMLYWKIANNEPASYDWLNEEYPEAAMIDWGGNAASAPIVVEAGCGIVSSSCTVPSVSFSALTYGGVYAGTWMYDTASTTISGPSALSLGVFTDHTVRSLWSGYETLAAGTTSVSSMTATASASTGFLGIGFVIAASSSGAPAPPVAVNENATTSENTAVQVNLAEGASNNPTSAAVVGTPVNGTVTISGTTATFTPASGFSGTGSFQFTLSNSGGTSNTATATITVSAPTTVVQKNHTVTGVDSANTSVTVNVPSGVSNGDLLTTYIATQSNTALTAPSGWTFAYQSTGASGQSGQLFWKIANNEPASYVWTNTSYPEALMIDWSGNAASAPIVVEAGCGSSSSSSCAVPSVSFSALANGGAYVGTWDYNTIPSTITGPSALSSGVITDHTQRSLWSGYETLAEGTTSVSSMTATASAATGFDGIGFVVAAAASGGGSKPVAVSENATTSENTAVQINLAEGASNNPTSAAVVGTPAHGTVNISGTTATFTPASGFSGTGSFQFTLSNSYGTSNTATAVVAANWGPNACVPVVSYPSGYTSNDVDNETVHTLIVNAMNSQLATLEADGCPPVPDMLHGMQGINLPTINTSLINSMYAAKQNTARWSLWWNGVTNSTGALVNVPAYFDQSYQASLEYAWTPVFLLSSGGPDSSIASFSNTAAAYQTFATYAANLVARYPDVTYWELWNEVDACQPNNCSTDIFGDYNGQSYYQQGQYYAQMLAKAVPAMKAVNPNIKILIGGLGGIDTTSTSFVQGVADGGGLPYIDIWNIHVYGTIAYRLLDEAMYYRTWLTAEGYGSMPMWATEWGDNSSSQETNEAAGYTDIQTYGMYQQDILYDANSNDGYEVFGYNGGTNGANLPNAAEQYFMSHP